MSNPLGDIADLFSGLIGGTTSDVAQGALPLSSWLSSAAGQLATAIESGFLAIIKDWWDTVLGPVEVFAGAVIIVIALFLMFKDDLMSAAAMFGMMAV